MGYRLSLKFSILAININQGRDELRKTTNVEIKGIIRAIVTKQSLKYANCLI